MKNAQTTIKVYVQLNGTTETPSVATLTRPLEWTAVVAEMLRAVTNVSPKTVFPDAVLNDCRVYLLPNGPNGVGAELNAPALRLGMRDSDSFVIFPDGQSWNNNSPNDDVGITSPGAAHQHHQHPLGAFAPPRMSPAQDPNKRGRSSSMKMHHHFSFKASSKSINDFQEPTFFNSLEFLEPGSSPFASNNVYLPSPFRPSVLLSSPSSNNMGLLNQGWSSRHVLTPIRGYNSTGAYGYRTSSSPLYADFLPLPAYQRVKSRARHDQRKPPRLSRQERRAKISHWLEKRQRRNWSSKKSYPIRHQIAQNRRRGQNGRFIPTAKLLEMARTEAEVMKREAGQAPEFKETLSTTTTVVPESTLAVGNHHPVRPNVV